MILLRSVHCRMKTTVKIRITIQIEPEVNFAHKGEKWYVRSRVKPKTKASTKLAKKRERYLLHSDFRQKM